jgi:hypothetical protein
MVKPSEIHAVGMAALEEMAQSQEEAWQRRLEEGFSAPKRSKKQRILTR